MTPHTSIALLIGRPGSGKGTQALRLTHTFGWEHFSTGNRFKDLRDSDTVLGSLVREAYDSGRLLPDWFATYLFEDFMLALPAEGGAVCEGYPRTVSQAETYHDIMTWLGRTYVVVHLMVPEEETVRRMMSRALVEDRPDSSTEEKMRARLAVYEAQTAPVLEFFRQKGVLTEIDGTGTPDEVEALLSGVLATPA